MMKNVDIRKLSTENRNVDTIDIDVLSTNEICKIINNNDKTVALAVEKELDSIAKVIDMVVESFQSGGRLIYVGAGTSGRIGLIDAVECRPTFSCDDEMVQCVIAGGKDAFVRAKEGAEDDTNQAILDLKAIKLTPNDIVIGIAASGRTPYVISAIEYANSVGAKTASIATVKNSLIGEISNQKIEVDTKAEVITGSTRLKAGTAQKLVCNMISTTSMIKIGKVYSNLMVDVKATNEKLIKRAQSIVMEVTGCSEDVATKKLEKYKNAKKAIVSIMCDVDNEKEIDKILEINKGSLRKVIG